MRGVLPYLARAASPGGGKEERAEEAKGPLVQPRISEPAERSQHAAGDLLLPPLLSCLRRDLGGITDGLFFVCHRAC